MSARCDRHVARYLEKAAARAPALSLCNPWGAPGGVIDLFIYSFIYPLNYSFIYLSIYGGAEGAQGGSPGAVERPGPPWSPPGTARGILAL